MPSDGASTTRIVLLTAVTCIERCYAARLLILVTSIACVAAGCATPDCQTLRVATLNIAHGRGTARSQVGLSRSTIEANLDAIADLIIRERPHIVALQEADAASSWSGSLDHVRRLAELAGRPHYYHGLHVDAEIGKAGLSYGTAMLSTLPLTKASSSAFHANPFDTKGFVVAKIEFDHREVGVVSLHLDSRTIRTRKKQARMLIDAMKTSRLPLVVMGDFNCEWPDDDALRMITQGLGLSAYQPEAAGLVTYPSTDPRERIDWILISKELRFVGHGTWNDPVSDHRGVTAALCWADD